MAALGPLAIVSQAVGAVESSLVMASLVLALIVVAVPGTALFLIALALLYFRACQASGEPLADVLGQFEKEALPAGYWQQHMRDRIRLQVESSR